MMLFTNVAFTIFAFALSIMFTFHWDGEYNPKNTILNTFKLIQAIALTVIVSVLYWNSGTFRVVSLGLVLLAIVFGLCYLIALFIGTYSKEKAE